MSYILTILNLKHLYEKDTIKERERPVIDAKEVLATQVIKKALVFRIHGNLTH